MYHFRAKIIGRSGAAGKTAAAAMAYRLGGKSAAATLAYRLGRKLRDPASGKAYDYSKKARVDENGFGILYAEAMLPGHAPAAFADAQYFIDAVEAAEKRKDAQLFRELEISLPRDLMLEQQVDLVRAFVQAHCVDKGMIAHIAWHDERASDGGRNPHVHVLLSMRSVGPEGLGPKVRAWNSSELVKEWREAWAEMANEALEAAGCEERIDHRSHRDRDIEVEPDTYIGPAKGRDIDGILIDHRRRLRDESRRRNTDALEADPAKLLAIVTREKATFTRGDLATAARRATGLPAWDERMEAIVDRALTQPGVLLIHRDDKGPDRFATRAMIECEQRMARAAATLARRRSSAMPAAAPETLSAEQQRAYAFVFEGPDLRCISGAAGTGKTTLLRAVTAAYRAQGRSVRGAALAGLAAAGLEQSTNAPSATVRSILNAWDRGYTDLPPERRPLSHKDVLLIDEAGQIPSRDMEKLLSAAADAGAKVVLVGDVQQLQAIEAGAAFRAMVDTYGAAELQDVQRQRQDWMRAATRAMAQGDIDTALDLYGDSGCVHALETTEDARKALVEDWMGSGPDVHSSLMLANSCADVRVLNETARERLRAEGRIGADVKVTIREQQRDENNEIIQRAAHRAFADGDRILFRRNDHALDVKNGQLGRVQHVSADGAFGVRMDDGRDVSFHVRDYPDIEQGYAVTIAKSQGVTVDNCFVLASRRFNAQLTYVAMSRHRSNVHLYYGEDQFGSAADLKAACARVEIKDTTLHYLDGYLAAQQAKDKERGARGRGGDTKTPLARPAHRPEKPEERQSAVREPPTPSRVAEASNPQSIVRRNAARRRALQMQKDRGPEFER